MAQAQNNSEFTLTTATHFARLTLKYGGIALVVLIVGRIFLTSFIGFWKTINPPPPPPPTVGFGILPRIPFPTQEAEDRPTSYTLETASGSTPDFGDRAKVFLMVRSTPNLLADQRAREIAASYNFVFEPEILDSQTYLWRKTDPIQMQLEMNVFTHMFELTSDFLSRPSLLSAEGLPDEFEAVQRVKSFLSTANLLPADVATSAGDVVYLKSLGGELSEAVSFSDADFIQIDLNRNPIDGQYRVYGPEGYKGSIHAIVSGGLQGRNSVVEMDYSYQSVDYDQVETYPLRTSQQAWKVLQGGEGYIAQLPTNSSEVVVRSVSMGYYEAAEQQEYLQPIYVFEGDDGFLGYISAIDPEYIQSQP